MGLVLAPMEVKMKMSIIRGVLNNNIDCYKEAQEKVQEFVGDDRLNTRAWAEMKDNLNICYRLIVEGILLAHDSIMSDMDTLDGAIGNEYLDEDELQAKKELLEIECKMYESNLRQLESSLMSGASGVLTKSAKECLNAMIERTREEIAILQEKIDFLKEAENNTKSLFMSAFNLFETVSNIIRDGKIVLNKGDVPTEPGWLKALQASDNDSIDEIDSNMEGILVLPKPGDRITISRGIDLENETAEVSQYNAWSIEYSIEGCNASYSGEECCERLNYAVEHYECNSADDDLLMFNLEGYDEVVFAGAMVKGYADIGDIVQVTLDDGNSFNFLILDVKNTEHLSEELNNGQCQCEWGHGYMLSEDKVQLSVCEFITAGSCSVDSGKYAKSGGFLKDRSVVSAQIVGSIPIGE